MSIVVLLSPGVVNARITQRTYRYLEVVPKELATSTWRAAQKIGQGQRPE